MYKRIALYSMSMSSKQGIPTKLVGRKFQGVAAREQIKLVQMFKMAESYGQFACLNISSSCQGSCQNTRKMKRFPEIFLCF